MRRRTVLASLPVTALALSGCSRLRRAGPHGQSTVEPTTTPDQWTRAYRIADLDVATQKVAPDHKWYFDVYRSETDAGVDEEHPDATERPVGDIEDRDQRTFVKRVIREREIAVDEAPDSVSDLVDQVDFFRWESAPTDGDATHFGLRVHDAHPDREPVLQFDATVTDSLAAPDDPGVVEFSVTNESDRKQRVYSGVVPPFSILRATGDDGETFLLWGDYETNDGVRFREGKVLVDGVLLTTPLTPGETVSRTYEFRGDKPNTASFGPGTYEVDDQLAYRPTWNAPKYAVDWTVSFDVERA